MHRDEDGVDRRRQGMEIREADAMMEIGEADVDELVAIERIRSAHSRSLGIKKRAIIKEKEAWTEEDDGSG